MAERATETVAVAHHGGRKFTVRPEAQNQNGFLGTGIGIAGCLWIAGAIMWGVGNAKVSQAGKIMFAVGFPLDLLIASSAKGVS
jgi:hypothetical protein